MPPPIIVLFYRNNNSAILTFIIIFKFTEARFAIPFHLYILLRYTCTYQDVFNNLSSG